MTDVSDGFVPVVDVGAPLPVAAAPAEFVAPLPVEVTVGVPYIQPVYVQQVAPVYVLQRAPSTPKAFGLTSMILGISAVIFSWTAVFAFILLSLAFLFGIISLRKKELPRGFAITGLILGSVAPLVAVVAVVVFAGLAAMLAGAGSGYYH